MNLKDAAYITGHDYPGGTSSLGPRIGISGNILANKLNPNCTTHRLTLDEAMHIMVITNDHRIFTAMSSELGYMVTPLAMSSDESVVQSLTHTIAEFGEMINAVSDSLKDNRITPLERRRINKELCDLMSEAGRLSTLIEGKAALAEQGA